MQLDLAQLLTAERVILNVIQRMSGIATMTRKAVLALDSSHTRICDTRKTMPGLRMFDKHAVVCGGGFNHRFGLYDGVMIKDNHIAFAGSITKAVTSILSSINLNPDSITKRPAKTPVSFARNVPFESKLSGKIS